MKYLLIPAVLLVLAACGYLAACAGAQRWLTFREWWGCDHRYDLADLSPRDEAGMVHCRCHKCGHVLSSDCGLTLPGCFDRNSSAARGVPGNQQGLPK